MEIRRPRHAEPGQVRISRGRRHWRAACGVAVALAANALAVTACGPIVSPVCAATAETLPASTSYSVIAVVPRTSLADADWGLDELAQLMPFIAHAGLQLHVLYTQDSDDLVEGGGDGGPPQVVSASAPAFGRFEVGAPPQRPVDPTSLTRQLYCNNLSAWQRHANEMVQTQASVRASMIADWAKMIAHRLTTLASKPIPDTAGSEAGTDPDSGASIFTAAQIAESAPRPVILFLGGLTALAPPSQNFPLSARLVALVRSSDPVQVLSAETSWRRWAQSHDGSFVALSANADPEVIAQEVGGGDG
jgi:hypothetical protein